MVGVDVYPASTGVVCIAVTVTFFGIVNRQVSVRSSFRERSNDQEFWKYRNCLISWIHSCIISVWNTACLLIYWQEIMTDFIDYRNPALYGLVAFTSGYFLYDFVDTLSFDHTQFAVLAHHVCVVGNFVYNLLECRCLPIAVFALGVEINTIFLHLRKLMQFWQVNRDSLVYRSVCWTNIVSGVIFRALPLAMIAYAFYTQGYKVPFWYLAFLWPTWLTMNVINVILIWRVFHNDVIKYYGKSKKSKQNGVHSKELFICSPIYDAKDSNSNNISNSSILPAKE